MKKLGDLIKEKSEENPLGFGMELIVGAAIVSWFVGQFATLQVHVPNDGSRTVGCTRFFCEVQVHNDPSVVWFWPVVLAVLAIVYRFKQWSWSYWPLLVVGAIYWLISFGWMLLAGLSQTNLLGAALNPILLEMAKVDYPNATFASAGVLSAVADQVCALVVATGCAIFVKERRESRTRGSSGKPAS